MGVLIDTAILIAAERNAFDLAGYLASLGDETIAIAAITASELLHSVERAKGVAVRAKRSAYVEGVLANLPVLPFGLTEARVHASLWATLAAKGHPIGAHDMLIAATAIAAESSIATLNRDEYRRVPSLKLSAVSRFVRNNK